MWSPTGKPTVILCGHDLGVRTNVPTAVRALRRAREWRQADLGAQATLSRDVVSRVENGELAGLTIGSLELLAAALEAALVVELRWQGADLDRLVDRAHAQLQEAVVDRLRSGGWVTHLEVSFNHYGDRGRCDVLAWHAPTRMLLIVEAKTRFGNLQETMGAVDVKRRLGRLLAEQVGAPDPRAVVVALVVAEHRTGRRIVQRYPSMFAAFALRGRAAASMDSCTRRRAHRTPLVRVFARFTWQPHQQAGTGPATTYCGSGAAGDNGSAVGAAPR